VVSHECTRTGGIPVYGIMRIAPSHASTRSCTTGDTRLLKLTAQSSTHPHCMVISIRENRILLMTVWMLHAGTANAIRISLQWWSRWLGQTGGQIPIKLLSHWAHATVNVTFPRAGIVRSKSYYTLHPNLRHLGLV